MLKLTFFLVCICVQCLIPAHSAETKKFAYCGGNIKFYIPTFLDKKSIEKQSEPVSCKNGLILKSRVGNKKVHIDISQSSGWGGKAAEVSEEYLAQFKKNHSRVEHYIFSSITPNGAVTFITFYWLDDTGKLKEIQKEIFFSKKDSISASASYMANPNDSNDVLFMNALEQLFLSAEIDW